MVCTSSIDLMSKKCPLKEYKYREETKIPKLSFVDDIADVTKCGDKAKHMNEYTLNEISKRKLQLASNKVHKMHVGKERECPDLYKDEWKIVKEKADGNIFLVDEYSGKSTIDSVNEQEYLGTVVTSNGNNTKTIANITSRGQGIINDIMNILNSIPIGKYYFETALILRSSLLLSVLTHDVEVLHNLTKNDVKKLESLDNQLISKIMET